MSKYSSIEIVDAVQFHQIDISNIKIAALSAYDKIKECFSEMPEWLDELIKSDKIYIHYLNNSKWNAVIETKENKMYWLYDTEWIVRYEDGTIQIYNNENFNKKYSFKYPQI